MITRKEFLATAYGLLATSALAACASNPTIEPQGWTEEERAKGRPAKKQVDADDASEEAEIEVEGTVVKVAAAGSPYVEILTKFALPMLEDEKATLQIVETDSADKANQAVASGSADASFCQRRDELDAYVGAKGADLASAASVMYWPFGIYSKKHDGINAIAEGMSVAIPDNGSQRGRALLLLHQEGVIKLRDANALEATVEDVEDNPNQLEFREMETGALVGALDEADFVVLDASGKATLTQSPEGEEGDEEGGEGTRTDVATSLHVADALAVEASDKPGAKAFGGVLATKADAVEDTSIAVLIQALKSKEFEAYLQDTYNQDIMPVA